MGWRERNSTFGPRISIMTEKLKVEYRDGRRHHKPNSTIDRIPSTNHNHHEEQTTHSFKVYIYVICWVMHWGRTKKSVSMFIIIFLLFLLVPDEDPDRSIPVRG